MNNLQSGISLFTPTTAFVVLCTSAATFAAGIMYRRLWHRLRGNGTTPSGFGVLLAFVVFGAVILAGGSLRMQLALGVAAGAAAIYWLDDVVELRARYRILLSFAAGMAIAAAFVMGSEGRTLATVLAICLAGGFVNVVLTNVVNFYDGADLNLATFIALTAGVMLAYAPAQPDWAPVAIACLAYITPFAVMNSRPKTIYLGDSGSFAFACLLTVMAVAYVRSPNSIPAEVAIPAALPTLDVFYVFCVRIIEKHDLLTRNYLHLYQRLNRGRQGFGYLLPQAVNAALCLVAAAFLKKVGFPDIAAVILAMTMVTVPFYFACRWILLDGDSASERGTAS
jgi:UDP-N-acetylmuramyl pentapeptide phosphotransferase/UDP-N-acetylglucosamine-1-phosphate transferase